MPTAPTYFDLADQPGFSNLRGIGSTPYFDTGGGFASPQNAFTPDSFATGQSIQERQRKPFVPIDSSGGGSVSSVGTVNRPKPFITEFGRGDFDAALVDWNRVYADAQEGIPAALDLIEQFAPGGSFGAGLRTEATDLVQQGLAADQASAFASGASSISSARGLNVLAKSELATQFANIDDLRAQLQIGAFSPYVNLIANLGRIGTARPTTSQFIDRIVTSGKPTTRSGGSSGGIGAFGFRA